MHKIAFNHEQFKRYCDIIFAFWMKTISDLWSHYVPWLWGERAVIFVTCVCITILWSTELWGCQGFMLAIYTRHRFIYLFSYLILIASFTRLPSLDVGEAELSSWAHSEQHQCKYHGQEAVMQHLGTKELPHNSRNFNSPPQNNTCISCCVVFRCVRCTRLACEQIVND